MIRQDTGIEVLMIFLTRLRKYRCMDCEASFRAPDRRRRPRADAKSVEKHLMSSGETPR